MYNSVSLKSIYFLTK